MQFSMSILYLLTFQRDGKWYKNACSLVNNFLAGSVTPSGWGLNAERAAYMQRRTRSVSRPGSLRPDSLFGLPANLHSSRASSSNPSASDHFPPLVGGDHPPSGSPSRHHETLEVQGSAPQPGSPGGSAGAGPRAWIWPTSSPGEAACGRNLPERRVGRRHVRAVSPGSDGLGPASLNGVSENARHSTPLGRPASGLRAHMRLHGVEACTLGNQATLRPSRHTAFRTGARSADVPVSARDTVT